MGWEMDCRNWLCAALAGLLLSLATPLPAFALDRTESAPNQAKGPLPRVLIIGDSISQGYHKTVIEQMQDKADVTRIPGNGEWTGTGVKKIDDWLGETQWDVIQFNFGLWDMYGWRYHEEDRSPEAYEKRLEKIVKRLEKTGAKLIWATTTPPCPEPEVTMLKRWKTEVVISPELEKAYLAAAARVMKKHKVQVNDLNALIKPDLDQYATAPDNVHFTAKGYTLLGRQVAAVIMKAIDPDAEKAKEQAPTDNAPQGSKRGRECTVSMPRCVRHTPGGYCYAVNQGRPFFFSQDHDDQAGTEQLTGTVPFSSPS